MNSEKMFIQIDDFYKEPHLVRNLSLNTEYHEQGALSDNVAGIESEISAYSQSVIERFQMLVGQRIDCRPKNNAFGRFRIMCEEDKRRTQVHTDNTDYTAVIYLSLNKHSKGGTCFYRHKETGLDHYPNRSELSDLGLTKQEFDTNIVLRDSLIEDAWEVIDYCEMKFNRCLILKGKKYFHGSNCFFGSNKENARITQNFFFNALSEKTYV